MDRDQEHILDIVSSARLVSSYIQGVEIGEFLRDTKLQDSVIRRLEVIGEAAGRVSLQFQAQHATVPWREMIGMRNRMIHRYDDIDLDIVWNTARESIPRLLEMIGPLAPPETD